MHVHINGRVHSVPEPWQEATLLEFLRDHLGLTGTKFGCGRGLCGACTVHLNGSAVRACMLAVSSIGAAQVTSIEGLAGADGPHAVQRAWAELGVPQCGYCQPGQIMSAAALLARNAAPTADDIDAAMAGNLCRCGTYDRIRRGIVRATELQGARP